MLFANLGDSVPKIHGRIRAALQRASLKRRTDVLDLGAAGCPKVDWVTVQRPTISVNALVVPKPGGARSKL